VFSSSSSDFTAAWSGDAAAGECPDILFVASDTNMSWPYSDTHAATMSIDIDNVFDNTDIVSA